ncbi:uncharacterized protein METZ01_LOCUS32363 [marine metagenome]|uniref:Uncharacterized protein n=1 Tax=marine metagenome TaxID=408172 RepID=A0A381QM30_9ZZZZ
MPSSFSTIHSSTLGFSPRLRVSVYGTVTASTPSRGFSWQYAPRPFAVPEGSFGIGARLLQADLPTRKRLPPCIGYSTTRRSLTLLRPPLRSNALCCGTGILTRCPSPTPFGLGLGTD